MHLRPRDVVFSVFTGDQIVLTRTPATWQTWLSRARNAGFRVAIIAQSNRTSPFPVIGVGGGEASTVSRTATHTEKQSLLQNTFRGYQALIRSYPDARWFLKVDDDTIVHLRHFWSALLRLDQHLTNGTNVDPSTRLHMVGDCARYCGGSALLLSRATVAGLANVSDDCIRWELSQKQARVGSDTAVTNCFLRVLGGRGGRHDHEGFYPWAPRAVNTTEQREDAGTNVSSQGSVGTCKASRLGRFHVADGWISYHHVVPEMMTEMHAALVREEEDTYGGASGAFESSARETDRSCAGLLTLEWGGGAIHRCVGVLCWDPR